MRDFVREVAVVVPAHDEEATIRACLESIHDAGRSLQACDLVYRLRVIVVLDSCRDRTAELATSAGAEVVTISARNVGSARAAGSARALTLSQAPAHQLWLANTDADSQVPGNWLVHMLRLAATGVDLVLGTAVPERRIGNRTLIKRWHALHSLEDGHPHIHGANLGIRADVYQALGGWAPLSTGEDVDLAARASVITGKIARSARIPVRTSSRLTGRAPDGYAHYLAELARATSAPILDMQAADRAATQLTTG